MKKVLLAVSLLSLILTCAFKGTNDETTIRTSAIIYEPDGKTPSAGAMVTVFSSMDTTRQCVALTYTDINGRYELKNLPADLYNIWVSHSTGAAKRLAKKMSGTDSTNDTDVAFQGSVFISGTSSTLKNDTLTCPSTFTGYIKIQPEDNPQTVTVQVLGSDKYFGNTDINGKFVMTGMAAGTYTLLFKSTLTDYTTTSQTITINSCAHETGKDSIPLIYTGIPVVLGLSATYDTINGVVHLKWNRPSFNDLWYYVIYRDNADSLNFSTKKYSTSYDTTFTDAVFNRNLASGAFSFHDPNTYNFSYRVAIINSVGTIGLMYKNVTITVASPLNYLPKMFTAATLSAAFSERVGQRSVVFNNKMWIIGGFDFTMPGTAKNDVWYSGDGVAWTQATDSAAFSPRFGHSCVVFNNKIWLIGGDDDYGDKNDVWSSSDGVSWTDVTDSAAFAPRKDHSCLVFNNKMWIMCGSYPGFGKDSGRYNDAWSSPDGITWTQTTQHLSYYGIGQTGHTSLVFAGKMWVIGGDNRGIWFSSDGVTWTQSISPVLFPKRLFHTSVVYDNKMWVIAGQDTSYTPLNDAWYSSDGITWSQVTNALGFSARFGHSSVVFNNLIWVIGGAGNGLYNDVWYSGIQVP